MQRNSTANIIGEFDNVRHVATAFLFTSFLCVVIVCVADVARSAFFRVLKLQKLIPVQTLPNAASRGPFSPLLSSYADKRSQVGTYDSLQRHDWQSYSSTSTPSRKRDGGGGVSVKMTRDGAVVNQNYAQQTVVPLEASTSQSNAEYSSCNNRMNFSETKV